MDEDNVGNSDYSVDAVLTKHIPSTIPIKGHRVKVTYPGIPALCNKCWKIGHSYWECADKTKTNWLELVGDFYIKDGVTDEMLSSWVQALYIFTREKEHEREKEREKQKAQESNEEDLRDYLKRMKSERDKKETREKSRSRSRSPIKKQDRQQDCQKGNQQRGRGQGRGRGRGNPNPNMQRGGGRGRGVKPQNKK